jgi:nucleotide-binding universal stress UspA family protein
VLQNAREAMMYKKVVVPLDGSKLAELALPHLEEIAKGCSIPEVLLVSVTEPLTGRLPADAEVDNYIAPERISTQAEIIIPYTARVAYPDSSPPDQTPNQRVQVTLGKMAKTASDYLNKVAEDLEAKGFNVETTVLIGKPAEQIVRYIDEQKADLVVMASAGKSKISRWDMSHIAGKVIKDTRAPVLLVKPAPGFKETKPKRRGVAT